MLTQRMHSSSNVGRDPQACLLHASCNAVTLLIVDDCVSTAAFSSLVYAIVHSNAVGSSLPISTSEPHMQISPLSISCSDKQAAFDFHANSSTTGLVSDCAEISKQIKSATSSTGLREEHTEGLTQLRPPVLQREWRFSFSGALTQMAMLLSSNVRNYILESHSTSICDTRIRKATSHGTLSTWRNLRPGHLTSKTNIVVTGIMTCPNILPANATSGLRLQDQ